MLILGIVCNVLIKPNHTTCKQVVCGCICIRVYVCVCVYMCCVCAEEVGCTKIYCSWLHSFHVTINTTVKNVSIQIVLLLFCKSTQYSMKLMSRFYPFAVALLDLSHAFCIIKQPVNASTLLWCVCKGLRVVCSVCSINSIDIKLRKFGETNLVEYTAWVT